MRVLERRAIQIRIERPGVGIVRVLVEEHVRDVELRARIERGHVEPHLVRPNRTAEAGIEVPQLSHRIGRAQSLSPQIVREVVRLHAVRRNAPEHRSVERVAAFARDDVDAHAAGRHVGGIGRVVERHFLDARHAVDQTCGEAGRRHRVHRNAVHRCPAVIAPAAMRRHPRRRVDDGAADVLRNVRRDAGIERAERPDVATRGDILDDVAIDDALAGGVLDINGRRFAGHGERLLERTHRQTAVHRRGEVAGHLDPFTLQRVEAGEHERHGVAARRQVDDLILAGAIRHGGTNFFDEGGTRRLNGDARQHGT